MCRPALKTVVFYKKNKVYVNCNFNLVKGDSLATNKNKIDSDMAITTVNALISAHGRLDFLCALGWALIRDGR